MLKARYIGLSALTYTGEDFDGVIQPNDVITLSRLPERDDFILLEEEPASAGLLDVESVTKTYGSPSSSPSTDELETTEAGSE